MSDIKITRRQWLVGTAALTSIGAPVIDSTSPAIADSIDSAFDYFTTEIIKNMPPLLPDPSALGGHVPNLQGLARDLSNIICQVEEDGSYGGGDSANRTGEAAFCNSKLDQSLLHLFEHGGIMVRHPTQYPVNNPKSSTRDQLIAYTAGCWRAGKLDINQRLLLQHVLRIPPFTCQDIEKDAPGSTKNPPIGDPLGPHDVMYLRVCAGDFAAVLDPAGQFVLQTAIELAGTNKTVDKNNLLLMSIICGRLNLFVQVIPNWADTLRYYWSGWRGQPRMAEELIWVVQKELERYPPTPASLLPKNLLALIRSLNLKSELTNINPAHQLQLGAKFVDASLRDAAATFTSTFNSPLKVGVTQLQSLGANPGQIANAFASNNQPAKAISDAFKANGIPMPGNINVLPPIQIPKSWPVPQAGKLLNPVNSKQISNTVKHILTPPKKIPTSPGDLIPH